MQGSSQLSRTKMVEKAVNPPGRTAPVSDDQSGKTETSVYGILAAATVTDPERSPPEIRKRESVRRGCCCFKRISSSVNIPHPETE